MFHRFAGLRHAHFVGIGGAGMSGIAEVLLQYEVTVSGCDQSAERGHGEAALAGRGDRHRPLRGPPRRRRPAGDLVGDRGREPRSHRGEAARHRRRPPGRDARRADAAQVRHRGRRDPRQDHHDVAGRRHHDRGGSRPDRHRRRAPARLGDRRPARQLGLHGRRGRRVRPQLPVALSDSRRHHVDRPRPPRHLPGPRRDPRRLRRLRQPCAVLRTGHRLRRRSERRRPSCRASRSAG